MAGRALVLGGGGVTGVAWELGVLEGLRRGGVDLSTADTVLGTSAGSVVATRITTGSITDAYDEQLTPPVHEMAAKLSGTTLVKLCVLMIRGHDGPAKFQRMGRAALAAHPEPGDARLEVIRSRIGDPAWPDRDLRITAVETDRGEFVVFDRTSGVSLLEAVAASCAVPLVWPPVRIGGRVHVDGGMRSPANADILPDLDTLVVLAPSKALPREHALGRQLERSGARRTHAITPDPEAEKEMGGNTLDPEFRRASALTGLRQGEQAAAEVAELWN